MIGQERSLAADMADPHQFDTWIGRSFTRKSDHKNKLRCTKPGQIEPNSRKTAAGTFHAPEMKRISRKIPTNRRIHV
jgi:hypothetical protein